ncbi:MAG TPA: AraC family transcriptional regulator [Kofleriaceae bacterium]|nr:AraC family transcriptional regulator [Kofleriaceae bacterium]
MGSVSVLFVRPLVAAIDAAVGPGLEAFWRATELTPQLIADDDARIMAPQLAAAWDEAIRLTGDQQLPLRAAAALRPGAFGIAEHVCRAAPTFGEALRQWVRYLNLLDDTATVGLDVEDDRALVRVVREREASAPAARALSWAIVARYARELCEAPVQPLAVELPHREPDDVEPYRAWFAAPVTFDAAAPQLVLPRSALAARLVPADPAPLALLLQIGEELGKRAAADPPMTQQVKRVLLDALRSDDAQVESVAKQLGLTVRSLQRRLKDEGTSFQGVREEVRRALAQRYLDAGLAVVEISFLLGFAEPSAFFRAFKRWTGMTPVEHRAQDRAAAAPA